MKKLTFLFVAGLFAMAACTKPTEGKYTVVKECDKTFVFDGTDYFLVCNDEVLAAVDSGTELSLAIKTEDKCENEYEACLIEPPLTLVITEKEVVNVAYQY